jgi:hypothetical protein
MHVMAKKKVAKVTKKATKVTKKKSTRAQEQEVDDAAVKKYGKSYKAWEATARKVFMGSKGVKKEAVQKVEVARQLMELAGGYEEAFVILDAVMIVAATMAGNK